MSVFSCGLGYHSWSVTKVPQTRTTEIEEIINGVRTITRTSETYYVIITVCDVCGMTT